MLVGRGALLGGVLGALALGVRGADVVVVVGAQRVLGVPAVFRAVVARGRLVHVPVRVADVRAPGRGLVGALGQLVVVRVQLRHGVDLGVDARVVALERPAAAVFHVVLDVRVHAVDARGYIVLLGIGSDGDEVLLRVVPDIHVARSLAVSRILSCRLMLIVVLRGLLAGPVSKTMEIILGWRMRRVATEHAAVVVVRSFRSLPESATVVLDESRAVVVEGQGLWRTR